MKKIFFLLANSLILSTTITAQSKVFSYGFEPNEAKVQTTLIGGIETQQKQYFNFRDFDPADVVDTLKQDASLARTGTGCLYVQNTLVKKDAWLRAVKLRNLNFKEHTSYRFTLWIKADSLFTLDSGVTNSVTNINMAPMIGVDYTDQAILAGDQKAAYGGWKSGYSSNKWVKKTIMFCYQDYASMQAWWVINKPSWAGSTLPQNFFMLFNIFTPGNYAIDDLAMYESTIGGVQYNKTKLTVDFGYNINVAGLGINGISVKSIDYPKTAFVVKANGTPVEIQSVTVSADQKVTITLATELSPTAAVTVDFTNPTSGAFILSYSDVKHPYSYDPADTYKVNNFTGEVAENYSTTVTTELKNVQDIKVNVFANNGKLFVSSALNENLHVEIYNVAGTILLKQDISGNSVLNIENLSKGIYMVRISNHKNEAKVTKIQL